ncbi:MAG: histidine kinase N-terminal 7TM domain-containing protein [Halorientalis sp.]
MVSSDTVLVVAYIGSGLLPWFLLRPVVRNWHKPGAIGMVLTIVGVSLWSLAAAAHTAVSSQSMAFGAWNVLLLGASLSSLGWFLVLGTYSGLLSPTRRLVALIMLEPLFVQVFAWTNPAHHLVYGPATSFTVVQSLVANYQLVFWIHAVIGYGLDLFVGLLILSQGISARGVQRTQSLALFVSLLPPALMNAVHLVVETPFDLTPFGSVLTVFILGWALFRAQFLDIVPIGRERAIENMSDAAVTIDSEGRVVDCNPAARELVGVGDNYVGMPADEFFSAFPDAVDRFREATTVDTEISVTREGSTRYFDLEISPISDPTGNREGRLVVFREITLLKRREQELRERQQDLDLLDPVC